jgi:hypothetical protein
VTRHLFTKLIYHEFEAPRDYQNKRKHDLFGESCSRSRLLEYHDSCHNPVDGVQHQIQKNQSGVHLEALNLVRITTTTGTDQNYPDDQEKSTVYQQDAQQEHDDDNSNVAAFRDGNFVNGAT